MTDKDTAHRDMANAIQALAMDAVQQTDLGHPCMPMGMADVATVLFSRFLKLGNAVSFALAEWLLAERFCRDVVDPAGGLGCERWLGARGAFVSVKGFGASAKASDLYKHFGIAAEAVAVEARRQAE
jgi:transketolase